MSDYVSDYVSDGLSNFRWGIWAVAEVPEHLLKI